jgi:GNAT superfamily N-acetyltransferase
LQRRHPPVTKGTIMSTIIEDFSPTASIAASEANMCASWADVGCPLPGELYDGPDMQRIVSGLPSPLFNAVYRARLAPDTVDEQIEAAIAPFKARGLDAFWWLTASSQPADLGARLEAHGLTFRGTTPDMVANLREIPPTAMPAGVVIEEVRTPERLLDANRVLMTSFHMGDEITIRLTERMAEVGFGGDAPWHVYLALRDGQPLATAALFLSHGMAGISNVGTLPEAQRQGLGAAVTRVAMVAGREHGYQVACLWSSKVGESVYRRLGFVEQHQNGMYLWPGSVNAGA